MEFQAKSQIHGNEWETLQYIKNLIFNLNKENIIQSSKLIISKFDNIYPLSFNLIIVRITYAIVIMRMKDIDLYLNFLKEIKKLEMNIHQEIDIFDIYGHFLVSKSTQESYYLLSKMIEDNLLDKKIIKNIKHSIASQGYFVQYMPNETIKELGDDKFTEYIQKNYEELSNNDWELHKKLIEEGVNPNEIAKIIRNDEIEKLQVISSQQNFDFNQTIEPSLYERCSFINHSNVTLIDYAAFFGSIECFKYLFMNNANVENTGKYAVAGGNQEIIHLCEQNHSSFEGAYETAIMFHRNDIFKYIYENEIIGIDNLEELGKKCITYHNYELLSYLQENDMKINDNIINEAAQTGNLLLTKYFLKFYQIPKNILVFSTISGNIELVKTILEKEGIDVNTKNIYLFYSKFELII